MPLWIKMPILYCAYGAFDVPTLILAQLLHKFKVCQICNSLTYTTVVQSVSSMI